LIAAIWVYRHLITGSWLTNHYQLNDPNIVNLVLAIFEPLAVAGVVAYWIWRTRSLYRLLFILFLAQLIVGAGFLAFILFFFLTWKAKMM
jgi:predicted membrane channel-forming protein YqfA (hemolysin III family)